MPRARTTDFVSLALSRLPSLSPRDGDRQPRRQPDAGERRRRALAAGAAAATKATVDADEGASVVKRSALLGSLTALLMAAPASAQEKRFDAETFRPSGAPRDLVMVQKSEVIGNLSPVVGLYADFAFNPNSEQEDVGEVQAIHLLLMLLRLVLVSHLLLLRLVSVATYSSCSSG